MFLHLPVLLVAKYTKARLSLISGIGIMAWRRSPHYR